MHIFAGEEPINIYYKGHLPRTYAECREAISQEQLEAEAPVIASLSLAADHVIPSANPEDTGRIYTLDPAKPSRKVLIVRSHLNIANVLAETTSLIVAHRPSTVTLADRVALMENGVVTAVGTHSELMATNDHYRYVISSLDEDDATAREEAMA